MVCWAIMAWCCWAIISLASWRVIYNEFIAGLFVVGSFLFLFVADSEDGILGFSGEVPGFTCFTCFTWFTRDSSNAWSTSFLGHWRISRILILKPVDSVYYQSLIGILIWIMELGWADICVQVSMLSSCLALPRYGYLLTGFSLRWSVLWQFGMSLTRAKTEYVIQ